MRVERLSREWGKAPAWEEALRKLSGKVFSDRGCDYVRSEPRNSARMKRTLTGRHRTMRYPSICAAIQKKRLLNFTYDFESRVVEPHAYGRTEEGNEILRAWQQTPLPAAWKTFRIDKIAGPAIADTRFSEPRSDYRSDDKAMGHVFCQL